MIYECVNCKKDFSTKSKSHPYACKRCVVMNFEFACKDVLSLFSEIDHNDRVRITMSIQCLAMRLFNQARNDIERLVKDEKE